MSVATGPYTLRHLVSRLRDVGRNGIPSDGEIDLMQRATASLLQKLTPDHWQRLDLTTFKAKELIDYLEHKEGKPLDPVIKSRFEQAMSWVGKLPFEAPPPRHDALFASGPVVEDPADVVARVEGRRHAVKAARSRKRSVVTAPASQSAPAPQSPVVTTPVNASTRSGSPTNADLIYFVNARISEVPEGAKSSFRHMKRAIETIMLANFGRTWMDKPLTAVKLHEAENTPSLRGSTSVRNELKNWLRQAVIRYEEVNGPVPGGPAFRAAEKVSIAVSGGGVSSRGTPELY